MNGRTRAACAVAHATAIGFAASSADAGEPDNPHASGGYDAVVIKYLPDGLQ